ncbi:MULTISPECIES: XrtB/PEP-CTERM-associated polysaccharide biosynthesis outer membrane protein EpsL [unclassified Massilia]|uniref:XrtB/PEP-CTERM-associated polysaccharide biosynthesis outer membrane protein EpsL n=1 Tax=unclassified Massilia TaxID=2609279 RepID=UPI0017875841|nr:MULTISPECIES: XrtB/PEP-CTERM-associated polysaccharide biosynthesis outer membrane protein EpsL [unclassified Massilia]MBD8531277.1 exopolysaccharide biosynthesis protein EpsL [Massilia sp. CFBP 13647]MBD8675914.1 exopolysaccharide biosynthesis protein EpsL [Massilia sp. CFBP 13721]
MSRICLHPLAFLAGVLIASLAPVPAAAIPGTPLDLYGRIGWAHDDNLLRIPDGAPAFDGRRSDSWTTFEFGAVLDKPIRRQRLLAVAKLSKVKFDHFRQLDYDGRDLQATWYWELGNRFSGKLGATHAQTPAPYTDFPSDERNLRKGRRSFFEGVWKLHPRWEARTALSRDRFDYELAAQSFNDRTEDVVELEGRYLARSGSTVGLVLRRIDGSYPNRRPFAGGVLTDDFRQEEIKARVDWKAGGSTTLQGLAGYARRSQPSFGAGRTSGANGRVTLLYDPGGKLTGRASVWRDFAPLESPVVSYTLNKGVSLGATWNATGKIRVEADAVHERRDYNPRDGFTGTGSLDDTLRSASLKASWEVRRKLTLSAAWVHQSRSGSPVLGIGDFKANTLAINASVQF